MRRPTARTALVVLAAALLLACGMSRATATGGASAPSTRHLAAAIGSASDDVGQAVAAAFHRPELGQLGRSGSEPSPLALGLGAVAAAIAAAFVVRRLGCLGHLRMVRSRFARLGGRAPPAPLY